MNFQSADIQNQTAEAMKRERNAMYQAFIICAYVIIWDQVWFPFQAKIFFTKILIFLLVLASLCGLSIHADPVCVLHWRHAVAE